MDIRVLDESLREAAAQWRGPIIVSRGRIHHLAQLPGYAVLIGGSIQGLVSFYIEDGECEIVSLDSRLENQGIGSKLIELVIHAAKDAGCERVWLITSNDNIRAIRFYQKRGFDLKAVHRDAITEARMLKPSIPLVGYDGIPIRHEIEFEVKLTLIVEADFRFFQQYFSCSAEIVPQLEELQLQFWQWIGDKNVDHPYWEYRDGSKFAANYKADAFVAWLNEQHFQKQVAKLTSAPHETSRRAVKTLLF
ncbi:GNAT family N-acetyltransferase [Paenibacillus thalictri]|uniref:GNAT family N-acetyltransferase n=1 Tax=Paenibacillus thalictri TaxID=2527873 RepID=UPI001F1174C2|nr:GNAT family N-acetyltransferase [Paenibacillus thalictri]